MEEDLVTSRQFGGFNNIGVELLLGLAFVAFIAYQVFRNVIIAVNALTVAVMANGGVLGREFTVLIPGEVVIYAFCSVKMLLFM